MDAVLLLYSNFCFWNNVRDIIIIIIIIIIFIINLKTILFYLPSNYLSYVYVCVYVSKHVRWCICVCMCVCVYMCVCACVCVCVCVCVCNNYPCFI